MGDGFYIHYGLSDALTDFLMVNDYESEIINMDVNVDGLPLCKSSSKNVWPILCNVPGYPEVMLIGVYEGYSKPKNADEYLSEFVNEVKELAETGFAYKNKMYSVGIRCFIMDAPARSFVLGIKGHSGYYSCTRCLQKGEMVKNRVAFLKIGMDPHRDNNSFRSRSQPEHHNKKDLTVLEILSIDIVKQVGLDYMHIVCLGVVRTLLKSWVKKKGEQYSLTSWKIGELSSELKNLKKSCPYEFSRKSRSLDELDRFKATELRQFLLYYGPFVLKPILSEKRYEHFLNLSLAIRINSNCSLADIKMAQNLLIGFVIELSSLYDPCFMTCNFHYLLHIHEEAKSFGSIETISAFRFENYLQTIKKQVKKSNNAAAQIYNRHVEKSYTLKRKQKNADIIFGRQLSDNEELYSFLKTN